MTLDELESAARIGTYVLLHLPPPNGRGYTRRLAGSRGPRGEIICGNDKGQTVRFLSSGVLRFVKAARAAGGE